jgi:hypothetical protein
MIIWDWIKNMFNKLVVAFKAFLSAIFNQATTLILAKVQEIAKQVVAEVNLLDLTDEEKRKAAFDKIKAIALSQGIEIKDSLINLAIELAVTYFKNINV